MFGHDTRPAPETFGRAIYVDRGTGLEHDPYLQPSNATCAELVRSRRAVRAQVRFRHAVVYEAFVVSPRSWAWRSSGMAAPAFVAFVD